jgi:peroxiredoxin
MPSAKERFLAQIRRGLLFAGAAVCAVLGFALLIHVGLPDEGSMLERVTLDGSGAITIGARAPLFTAPLLDGALLDLRTLRGSVVVLNFWATWCPPCAIELKELEAVADMLADHRLRVIAVNTGEDVPTIAAWINQLDVRLTVALDANLHIGRMYWVVGQPTTYIIDRDGVIRTAFYGPITRDALSAALLPYLRET